MLLLKKLTKIEHPSDKDSWEVHMAVKQNDLETLMKLLRTSSSPSSCCSSLCKANSRFLGETLLTTGVKGNSVNICEALLAHGADPNKRSEEKGRKEPPLMSAIRYHYNQCALLLLQNQAKIQLVNFYGQDSIYQSVAVQNEEMLKEMLGRVCFENIDVHNLYASCPLLRALNDSSAEKRNNIGRGGQGGSCMGKRHRCLCLLFQYNYNCPCVKEEVRAVGSSFYEKVENLRKDVTRSESSRSKFQSNSRDHRAGGSASIKDNKTESRDVHVCTRKLNLLNSSTCTLNLSKTHAVSIRVVEPLTLKTLCRTVITTRVVSFSKRNHENFYHALLKLNLPERVLTLLLMEYDVLQISKTEIENCEDESLPGILQFSCFLE